MSEWFQANAWHYLLLYFLVSFVLTLLQVVLTLLLGGVFLPLFSKKDNGRGKSLLVCSEGLAVVWSWALAFWFAYNSFQIGFFFLSGWICATWGSSAGPQIASILDKLKSE